MQGEGDKRFQGDGQAQLFVTLKVRVYSDLASASIALFGLRIAYVGNLSRRKRISLKRMFRSLVTKGDDPGPVQSNVVIYCLHSARWLG